MKKLLAPFLMALMMTTISVAPASANQISVSVRKSASAVVFETRLPRPSKLRVTVYKGHRTIKTMRTKSKSSRQAVRWDVRDSRGAVVPGGVYSFTVAALSRSASSRYRGKVAVAPPAPAAPPAIGSPVVGGRWVGVYVPGCPASLTGLGTLESEIATHAAVLNFFISDGESFPLSRVQNAAAHGSTPMITLEFWSTQDGGLAGLIGGSKDAYLSNFADAAKAYGGPVMLRPFHEMNGNWYPWCGTVGGNTPAQAVAAYRHVHDIFASRGAANVKFVWCVNNDNVPSTSANDVKNYWPGDAYVDYPSIDGYNFGTYASWSKWRPFGSVVGAAYSSVCSLTGKPIIIAETGCVDQGGDKAAWITDMFASISSKYTRIVGVCWFDQLKGEDWRIDSTAASVSAFKAAVAQGF